MILRCIQFICVFILSVSCYVQTIPEKVFNNKSLIINDTIPFFLHLTEDALTDVHHLLKLGFIKAGKKFDTPDFRLEIESSLKDSISIFSHSNNIILLKIGHPENASVALYSYLDILGYRFYGPENHWTHIPSLPTAMSIDTTIVSFFPFRWIGPSYGISKKSTPSLESSEQEFDRWRKRLRMVKLLDIPAGHYGSTFNRKYRIEIEGHPEWRGHDEKGNYRRWSENLKLCYTHPEVIELYKKDAIERLENEMKVENPPYYINMEPPDGGDYCACPECNREVSDQVYGLANEIAKLLQQKSKEAFVTMYGYNRHALPPSFPLEENIIVGIVPYEFHGLGSPERVFNEWDNVESLLYLRDYLGIPIWEKNRPVFDPNHTFLKKISHLKDYDYIGYRFETTSSFMSVGLQFFMLSKASWNEVDEEKEYELFLESMFPGFEKEVSLIYENLPFLSENSYDNALNRVRSLASKAGKKKELLIRLQDLEFYIEYLYLLEQFENNKSEENLNPLLDKIMSEPGARLLHTYGLYRVLKREIDFDRPIERTVNKSVEISKGNEIQIELRSRKRRVFKTLNPDFYLDSVNSFVPIPIRNSKGLVWIGDNHDGKLFFKARVELIRETGLGILVFRNMADEVIEEIEISTGDELIRYEIKLPKNQFCKVEFKTPSSNLYFQGPNRPFVFTEQLFTRYIYKRVPFYFRIPDNQNSAHIEIPRKTYQVNVLDGGDLLISKDQYDPYEIEIKNKAGKVIEVNMNRHGIRMIDFPQLVALHPQGVIYLEE